MVRRYGAGHTRLHSVHPPTPHTGTCFITTGQVTDQNGRDGTVEMVYGRDDPVPGDEDRRETGDDTRDDPVPDDEDREETGDDTRDDPVPGDEDRWLYPLESDQE